MKRWAEVSRSKAFGMGGQQEHMPAGDAVRPAMGASSGIQALVSPIRTIDADRVAAARSSMPTTSDVVDLADVFALLGEPNRVRILVSLLGGPMCVRDLAAVIGLSESAVSHALRLLRMHRVVEVTRSGRVAHYAIADFHVRDLLERGLEHVGHTMLLHSTASEPGHGGAGGPEVCGPGGQR